jgi:hypothetical protein
VKCVTTGIGHTVSINIAVDCVDVSTKCSVHYVPIWCSAGSAPVYDWELALKVCMGAGTGIPRGDTARTGTCCETERKARRGWRK